MDRKLKSLAGVALLLLLAWFFGIDELKNVLGGGGPETEQTGSPHQQPGPGKLPPPKGPTAPDNLPGGEVEAEGGTAPPNTVNGRLQSKRLVYTQHARCRMGCRHISETEIAEILQKGKMNPKKSRLNDSPCPTFALEGRTRDNQQVRIVFAECDDATKVVTAIDLNQHYNCTCN